MVFIEIFIETYKLENALCVIDYLSFLRLALLNHSKTIIQIFEIPSLYPIQHYK